MKQPIPKLICITLFCCGCGFVQDALICNWISPYSLIRGPCFSQRQGFNKLLVFFTFLQDLGIFLSQYFTPVLETVDFLLPFVGLL